MRHRAYAQCRQGAARRKIAELFGDEGYQVAFECAGVESSVRSLMATVEKGGDVVIVGVHAKDPAVSMFHLGEHELNLIGSMMYRHEDYLKAVEEISAGRIRLAPLVSNRFRWRNIGRPTNSSTPTAKLV